MTASIWPVRLRLNRLKWRIILLLALQVPAGAMPLAAERGPPRSIEPHFLGFNQNFMGRTDPWTDRLVAQLRATGLANFRYPAGTVGSYWNWRTGRIDESLAPEDVMSWVQPFVRGGPQVGRGRYTLENLKRAVDGTGVAPILMLGMAVHDLEDQIEILQEARRSGIPIRYLELGNELVFENAEPLLERLFPDAETYGRVATDWIRRLEEAFPGVRVAVCGSFVGSDRQSERRRTWNARMMRTLRGGRIITTHLYAAEIVRTERERLGLSEVQAQQGLSEAELAARTLSPTPENTAKTIGLAYEVWERLLAKTEVPRGMDVWVTEWSTGGVGGSGEHWMNGLTTASLLDAFLRTNVTLTCHHTMSSVFRRPAGGRNGPSDPGAQPELTATGIVLREFAVAMNGRTEVSELKYASAPRIVLSSGRSYPSVVGWAFETASAPDRGSAILMNLGSVPLTVALPSSYTEYRQLSGSPADAPGQLQPQKSAATAVLILPAFSLTVLSR